MKTFLIYFLEIAIAATILWFDQRLFLLYFFVVVLMHIDRRFDQTIGLLTIWSVESSSWLAAIIKKLDISKSEVDELYQQGLDTMGSEARKDFEKLLGKYSLR